MKVFSKEQIYEADAITIQKQQISSTDLMERAGIQIFNWIHKRMQGAQVPIHVFCGIGNNGGDGLVLARHLITYGYNVNTYVVNYSDKRSKDFLINYDRIKQTTKDWPTLLNKDSNLPTIHKDDIIVDAVFGIGLNRALEAWVVNVFHHFKNSNAFTLSIDIPSGLYPDKVVENENQVVYANYTLSFLSPKLVFFLPETAKYTIQWEILEIGFDPEYVYTTPTEANFIIKQDILPLYKPRDKFSHKGSFGHSLIIGGSYGKIGATILASKGALSIGSGLVTAFSPKCGYAILQSTCPEIMVETDVNEKYITNIKYTAKANTIGIGVGLGTQTKTVTAFEAFLKTNKTPLVIDADGINILAKKKTLLKLLPSQTILTPHPKELERLVGTWKNDFEKLEKIKALSKKHDIIIVLKGAHTIIQYQDYFYINSTGNPGLATAGTGDVLTGIITGLIAQSYPPIYATIFGVYLHGKAADIAIADYGYESMTASVVVDYLAEAYLDLFKQPEQPQPQDENEEEKTNNG